MKKAANSQVYQALGASLVEYVLLVALISIVAVVAIRVFGTTMSAQYSNISHETFGP